MKKIAGNKQLFELLLFVFAFLTSWTINSVNLSFLEKSNPEKIRLHTTIKTSDDLSYLIPPENFLLSGDWKDNFAGKGAYFQREPGYGMLYLGFRSCGFSLYQSLILIKYLQLLLFSVSAILFYRIAKIFTGNIVISKLLGVFYGCTPLFQGFLFYTLTEGITPALLLIFIYTLIQKKELSGKWFILSAILLSYVILVRPFLMVFLVVPLLFIVFQNNLSNVARLKRVTGYLMISLFPFVFWLVRNYQMTGEFTGLHPIYYKENNSMFRPTHRVIGDFARCWAPRSDEFHLWMAKLWQSGMDNERKQVAIDFVLGEIPSWVIDQIGRAQLNSAFEKYINSVNDLKYYFENQVPVPDSVFENERLTIQNFESFRNTLNQHFFFRCNVITPIQCYARMGFHSNLNLYMFQEKFRGTWWMETIRWCFTGLHSLLFILIFPCIFLTTKNKELFFISIAIAGGLIYLAFFQRLVEERYTLPILPFILLIVITAIHEKFKVTSLKLRVFKL